MDSLVHIAFIDSEIINENYVAVDSEIINDDGVISGFTFFVGCS
jgi:hypothetical protein